MPGTLAGTTGGWAQLGLPTGVPTRGLSGMTGMLMWHPTVRPSTSALFHERRVLGLLRAGGCGRSFPS